MKRKRSHLCWEYIWKSTSAEANSLDHLVWGIIYSLLSALYSTWHFCWASQLSSTLKSQPNAPFITSLYNLRPPLNFIHSPNPPSSFQLGDRLLFPTGVSPSQPYEPDEYFKRNGTKSQLSLSLGLIFFYKAKQNELAKLSGWLQFNTVLINAQ